MPATFSLLGDHYPQEKRGRALGVIGAVGAMGIVLGVLALGFVATPELWRWGFIGLGIASVLTGVVIWLLVEEPPRGSAEPELAGLVNRETEKRYMINWKDVFSTLRIPTIWAAILQGVTGSMPWVVMSIYLINWMVKDLGFSNTITFSDASGSAPLVFALIVIGAAISNYMGGVIGDFAEKKSPKYGQNHYWSIFGSGGYPINLYSLQAGKEYDFLANSSALHFVPPLLISWPGRGAKEPMMQAIVTPEMRSSAYSVVSFIEGGLSAFSGLIAGALADKIGLTNALLWTVPFPWILCGIGFTLFYFTYPRMQPEFGQKLAERRD